jgi:hypothetical protein
MPSCRRASSDSGMKDWKGLGMVRISMGERLNHEDRKTTNQDRNFFVVFPSSW